MRKNVYTLVAPRSAKIGTWLVALLLLVAGVVLVSRMSVWPVVAGVVLLMLFAWQTALGIHTIYTLTYTLSEDEQTLFGATIEIDRSYYGRKTIIKVDTIAHLSRERALFGLWSYLLIEQRDGHLTAIQPQHPQQWMNTLNKLLQL